jgi:hypothetical protein
MVVPLQGPDATWSGTPHLSRRRAALPAQAIRITPAAGPGACPVAFNIRYQVLYEQC